MIKKLLLLSLSVFSVFGFAQNLMVENFDTLGDPVVLPTGWTETNQSSPLGTINWFRGGGGTTFAGYNGGQTGYIGANFNSTSGSGIISNWLMSPTITLENGDIISFYTRTATGSTWADNLEMRISTAGATSVNPSGSTGIGDYTLLAVTVNTVFPTASGYPQTWTQYTYTVTGLSGATSCRIAFRYTVPTSAGPSGNYSNYIGIDAFSVDRPLSSDSFFKNNFSIYPNPVNDMLNISMKNEITINNLSITDLNGRVVSSSDSSTSIDVSSLSSGVYFISVETNEGKGTSKFVKN